MPASQQDFISTYGPLAKDIAGETGLDPSTILGQIGQETGYGQHVQGNNIFGISPGGKVANYPSVQDAAQAYIQLIKSRYGNASSTHDPAAQAQIINTDGYNPDPAYGRKVANVANQLKQQGAPSGNGDVDPDFAARWGMAPQAQPVAKAPKAIVAPAPAAPANDDFEARWGIKQPAAPAPSAPTAAVPAQVAPQAAAAAPTADRYAGWDVPSAPAAPAAGGNSLMSYQGISNALQPAPNTTYGSILPFARDNATGAIRPAMPTSLRNLAQGAVDLGQGPTSGTVTPKAQEALASVIAPALMKSPAAGTGAAIAATAGDTTAPLSYMDRASVANARNIDDIATQNQLQAQAPLSPEFKANPGVTGPQTVTQPGPVSANPAVNPLSGATPPRPANPLSSNAAAAPAPPEITAPTSESAEYAAIPDKLPPAPLLPPLTQGAADSRADELINHFSTRKGVSPTPPNLIPGFMPTLAQKTADPGLATLERGMQSVNPGPFQLRNEANQAVMQSFLQNLTKDPEDIATASAARAAATTPLRDAAFENKAPVDPSPVESMGNAILGSPEGKRDAIQSTVGDVMNRLHVNNDPTQPLETDPEMLYGVRKHINDMLDPVAQRDKPQYQQAASQLIGLRGALDDQIEEGAPGFKNYISTFAQQSKPIDQMRYLQSLNLTDANGNLSLPSVAKAVKTVIKQRALPGVQNSTAVSDDQLAALTQLRDTLRAQGSSATGKALGSNTFQNLATNSRVGAVTGNPLIQLGLTAAGSVAGGTIGAMGGAAMHMGANSVASNAENMVKNATMERLLNLQGKGDAVFSAKSAGPTYRGRPVPPANPLAGATP